MIERVDEWRHKLNVHIHENRHAPFVWGTHDCCTWASSCVEVITGINPIEGIAGTYNGPLGASNRLRKKLGAKSVMQVCSRLYGPMKAPAFARAGDIVLADIALLANEKVVSRLFGNALGICNGRRSYFVGENLSRAGLIEFETTSLVGCFHV